MIFDTKGEFIQALKDYKNYGELALKWKNMYREYYYLRYEKISSPLDYDIVGYENNEPIREIKKHSVYNSDLVNAKKEELEDNMQYCLDEYSKLQVKMQNVMSDLKSIDEPLHTVLDLKYLKHKTLKEVSKKCNLYLDESGMYKYIMRGLDKYYEK